MIRLATEADVSVQIAEKAMKMVQQLDPKGCASRDLQECLLIQARALQHLQMARDCGEAHRERRRELVDRRLALGKPR